MQDVLCSHIFGYWLFAAPTEVLARYCRMVVLVRFAANIVHASN